MLLLAWCSLWPHAYKTAAPRFSFNARGDNDAENIVSPELGARCLWQGCHQHVASLVIKVALTSITPCIALTNLDARQASESRRAASAEVLFAKAGDANEHPPVCELNHTRYQAQFIGTKVHKGAGRLVVLEIGCEGGGDARNIAARRWATVSSCEIPFLLVRTPCGIILGLGAFQCRSSGSNDEHQRQANDASRSCPSGKNGRHLLSKSSCTRRAKPETMLRASSTRSTCTANPIRVPACLVASPIPPFALKTHDMTPPSSRQQANPEFAYLALPIRRGDDWLRLTSKLISPRVSTASGFALASFPPNPSPRALRALSVSEIRSPTFLPLFVSMPNPLPSPTPTSSSPPSPVGT